MGFLPDGALRGAVEHLLAAGEHVERVCLHGVALAGAAVHAVAASVLDGHDVVARARGDRVAAATLERLELGL